MTMKFTAYNPFIKQLRSDKGWRVEFDVSQSEYDIIKELPKVEGKILSISVEEIGEYYPQFNIGDEVVDNKAKPRIK